MKTKIILAGVLLSSFAFARTNHTKRPQYTQENVRECVTLQQSIARFNRLIRDADTAAARRKHRNQQRPFRYKFHQKRCRSVLAGANSESLK